jgi:hypothetical protein
MDPNQGAYAGGWGQYDGWQDTALETEETVVNTDQLAFIPSNYEGSYNAYPPSQPPSNQRYEPKMSFFYDQGNNYSQQPTILQPQFPPPGANQYPSTNFEDEPPLLEELEIYPDQILKKVMVVLDPFNSSVPLGDYDLVGPLIFCLFLSFAMLFSGGKVNFGYVYGIAVWSCLMMYCLLWLMTNNNNSVSLLSVASILGYSLLPVVILSTIGVFFTLKNKFGYSLAILAVGWSSLAASRIFMTITAEKDQRPLIAYPCGLLYAVFTLLVLF